MRRECRDRGAHRAVTVLGKRVLEPSTVDVPTQPAHVKLALVDGTIGGGGPAASAAAEAATSTAAEATAVSTSATPAR